MTPTGTTVDLEPTGIDASASCVLRRALGRLDERGRFDAGDLPALREAVRALAEETASVDHPAELLGPWHGLGERARSALRDLVATDLRTSAALYPHGSVWTGLIRAFRHVDAHLTGWRRASPLRRHVVRSAVRLHDGPMHAGRRARAALGRRRWGRAARPSIADALAALGRDPRWLIGDYVRGVALPPSAPGYWDDPGRNVVHGYHLGLDLLATPSGVCCIEANLRTGLYRDRAPARVGSSIPVGAMALARSLGARRVIWVELQKIPLSDRVLGELAAAAREAGITVEILEDPTQFCRGPRSSLAHEVGVYRPLDEVPPNTLVLSRRQRSWGGDYLVTHKEPSTRVLDAYLRETGDRNFFVLPLTRDPDVPEASDPGLPNVVYKYPDSGSGKGVFFMRARDKAHAVEMARRLDRRRGEPPGLFQRFARGSLAEGRRVFDVRTEIFVTPRGVRFGAALRRVSGSPVPDHVPYGLVDHTAAFASNLSAGGRLERPGEEMPAVRQAALSVGEAFRRALNDTFVAGPAR